MKLVQPVLMQLSLHGTMRGVRFSEWPQDMQTSSIAKFTSL
jgi:hypothetical protein